ncbi:MAG TPA: SIMPL domain-containing protein [Balneolaceae bacterium]
MNYLIILLSFLFLTGGTEPEERVLSISVEEQVEVPADIIQFNINLNAEAETPQAAYQLHNKREEVLVNLLEKYDIAEEDIDYQPISIHKTNDYRRSENEKPTYQTRQSVSLILKDFEVYEQLQIGLIENGFDNFGGTFMSTKAETGKSKALQKAIQTAKEKAQLIAEEAGLQLGNILRINYSEHQYRPMYSVETMAVKAAPDQLTQYEQTVTFSASVAIDFELVK